MIKKINNFFCVLAIVVLTFFTPSNTMKRRLPEPAHQTINQPSQTLPDPVLNNGQLLMLPFIKEKPENQSAREEVDKLKTLIKALIVPESKPISMNHSGHVNALALYGDYIISGSSDFVAGLDPSYSRNLFVSDMIGQNVIKELSSDQAIVSAIAVSPDGHYFVTGGDSRGDTKLTLWKRDTYEKINLSGHGGQISSVAFSPDGTMLVSASKSEDNNLFVWDVKQGKRLHKLSGYKKNSVNAVAFSVDGTIIASGSSGDKDNLLLWNARTGKKINKLNAHKKEVNTLAFSPDGISLVSGGSGNKDNVVLWAMSTRKGKILSGHSGDVTCVAFSPDGTKIVSAAEGDVNNLSVRSATGQLLYHLKGHTGSVRSIAFGNNLRKNWLVAGGDGKQNNLFIWDIVSGHKIYNLVNDQDVISSVAFSSDGTKIVSGGGNKYGDNSLIVWDLNSSMVYDLTQLKNEQIDFLYMLYLKARSNTEIDLTNEPEQLKIYNTLSVTIKQLVCERFNIRGVDCNQEPNIKKRRQ